MVQYQAWALDDAYAKQALIDKWTKLSYSIGLNRACSAHIDLQMSDAKIPDCALMNRIRILRNGAHVFGGLFQTESWEAAEATPQAGILGLDASDHAAYLGWRTIPRPAGQDFDTRTDHADDLAKAYVRYHAGASAGTGRPLPDLTVAADAGAVASTTKSYVGGILIDYVNEIATEKLFYWRMVPGAAGCTFTTYYPLAGLDRTKGNGINAELVLSFGRKNVLKMSYKRDLLTHANYMYVAGAGEGKAQLVVERPRNVYVTAYKRREMWVDGSKYTTTGALQAEGDRAIEAAKPVEVMSVVAKPGVITPANLGDQITIFDRRYGRAVEFTAVIVAMQIEVFPNGTENITPELVAA